MKGGRKKTSEASLHHLLTNAYKSASLHFQQRLTAIVMLNIILYVLL